MNGLDGKCGCGRDVRYSSQDGKGACNKYARCLSWEQQDKLIKKLRSEVNKLKPALEEIRDTVDGEPYEYRYLAHQALDRKIT